MNFLEKIIKTLLKDGIKDSEGLARVKRKLSKTHKISCPSNMALLKTYHEMLKKRKVKRSEALELVLRTRPVRSLSGIVNVSVLTKHYPCPGKCIYCPNEKGMPKSYVSGEPAAERAKKLKYDPFVQTKRRIEMLEAEGHPTEKIELRIVGGTWSYYPEKYRNWFVRRCFEACNQRSAKSLKEAQKANEKAKHRMIGLSVETRPDFINDNEIKHLRILGVTMVELGIQSIYDEVLNKNLRGNTRKDIISATRMLKDAGFKVLYQVMPNLPGSNMKKDKEMFKELFSNPDFRPDLLKIYPLALLKSAPLYETWKKGGFKLYSEKQLKELIKSVKKIVPFYVRIQRITRDIPSFLIIKGPAKISNLRQYILTEMKKEGWQCKCIRCREVKERYLKGEKVFLFSKEYEASEGSEIFLSFEDKKRTKLYSLLRLRINKDEKAFVRELHTFGQQKPIKTKSSEKAPQHMGFGKRLMKEAERIAKKNKIKEIRVISGIGVREYYRSLGYSLKGTYMVKELR